MPACFTSTTTIARPATRSKPSASVGLGGAVAEWEKARLAELGEGDRGDGACVARDSLQRLVVQEHHRAVRGRAHVDLDGVDAGLERGMDAGKRVLRHCAGLGAVGDNEGRGHR